MDFSLDDDLIMIRDGVSRFITDNYGFEARRELIDSDDGFSRNNWRRFAELGWLGAALPEEAGGIGMGPRASMVIMGELGKGLVVEPYLATVILGGELIARYGSQAQRDEILPQIAAGEIMLTLAHAEPGARYDLHGIATKAAPSGDGYVINGAKGMVLNAAGADRIIIPARTSGDRSDKSGISLFLVNGDAPGLSRHDYKTYDGGRASELELTDVAVSDADLIGALDQGHDALEEIMDHGLAALCAEAVGVMEVLFEATLEYLKTRKQFGRAIGEFQALQHRMSDMYMSLENARSMAFAATIALEGDDPDHRREEVAMAKVQINESAHLIGRQGAQMHGAIAITDELAAGHYYKRLSAIEALFGNSEHHLGRLADMG
ncbi:MAG: pimeloyl-CoA dehydrogenase small subunit [Rhodospirillaceae bacterium]|jgi:alkylation response protein AidB-like acyl-CoA dehydrogenase|nr:pimeloyl-CoA dehydrogenase small subunit [Rhodospirillaceae bacterium]MBT4491070.1 pimeloyl-CoA dehydrogenase small subunit [Rhodospirillaceae bacterium]MBT5193651.1 pimeloyl-CoA dehydrogenase small subunit [Rhodospirillaceae bacterium]MBT5895239.1 pimeloyl-CoA dehydrogenase small subunit [Rhodospirillaceae bacterium]